MERRCLAIRILGVASTSRGFAFATTEGPLRLIDWGNRRGSHTKQVQALNATVEKSRPLFVACEIERNQRKSLRSRNFNRALKRVCAKHRIMILCVERKRDTAQRQGEPTNYDIAQAAAARFPSIADCLPKERRVWEGGDDRIGIFLAAAAAVGGWNHFRPTE